MSGDSRLLDQVRDVIRIKHYSIRTEQAYLQWIRRYIIFHGKRHPGELGSEHLSTFLSHLAVRGNVAASTQNQALNAILFLYREVLRQKLPWVDEVHRAKRPQHLPVVLTNAEIKRLLAQLEGTRWLMAALTYGGGLRLLECLRLRVKDLDFDRCEVTVRDGKGQKDRVTMLPRTLIEPLRTHLTRVRLLHGVTSPTATVACTCRSPSTANIHTPIATGRGSTSSHRRADPSIPARVSSADTMRAPMCCNVRSRTPCVPPAS